jgi:hypothetical protein
MGWGGGGAYLKHKANGLSKNQVRPSGKFVVKISIRGVWRFYGSSSTVNTK